MVFEALFLILSARAESKLIPLPAPTVHETTQVKVKREVAPAVKLKGGASVLAHWAKTNNTGNDNLQARYKNYHGCCYRRKAETKSPAANISARIPGEPDFVWEGGCKKESRKLDVQSDFTDVDEDVELTAKNNLMWSKTPLYSKGEPVSLKFDVAAKAYLNEENTDKRFFAVRFGVNRKGRNIAMTFQQDTDLETENEDNPAQRFVKTHTLRQIVCAYHPLN